MIPATLPPGAIGPYRIGGVLGRGGMGVVYRGEHVASGARAAVKTLHRVDRARLDAIRREVRVLGRLEHPGVVRLLDDGVVDGRPWYAMDLLEGETLRDVLRRLAPGAPAQGDTTRADPAPARLRDEPSAAARRDQPDPGARRDEPREEADRGARATLPAELARILRRLCATLAYLHGRGVVHRDLKPENVFVRDGGAPVLVDLGLASRLGGAAGRDEIEAAVTAFGSAAYMAPEQIRGALVDARADLYALGAIVYECVTGAPPFPYATRAAVLRAHLDERPAKLSARRTGVPPALDLLVARLLEKRPRDRAGYADDVARALATLGGAGEGDDDGQGLRGAPAARAYLYRPETAGREALLARIDAAVRAAARERRGARIYLGGESGSGKTRIALEAIRAAERHGVSVLLAAPAAGAGTTAPLQPFAPALLAVADRCRALGGGEAARLLGDAAPLLAPYQPALAPFASDELAPAPSIAKEASTARVVGAVVHAVIGLADAEPTLLVLDDLQWADDLSLACLQAIGEADLARRPLIVLGAYRSDEASAALDATASAASASRLELGPMGAPDVAAMAAGMLALDVAPAPLAALLERHCHGNPFFIAEYLHAAVAEGFLARDAAGRWRLGAPGAITGPLDVAVRMPRGVAALVDRRLDALDPDVRAVAHAAAVLGRGFNEALLAATAVAPSDGAARRPGDEARAVADAIDALRRRRILEEADGGDLRFAHDTIREVAYLRLAGDERRDLHRRAGEALEARGADAGAARTLGHHFARGGVHDKALRHFERAGAWARAAYANDEAIACLRAALDAADRLDPEAAAALAAPIASAAEQLGDVLTLVGAQGEARLAYRAALDRAGAHLALDRSRLHRKIGKTWETHHRHDEALAAYAEAEAALQRTDAPTPGRADAAEPRAAAQDAGAAGAAGDGSAPRAAGDAAAARWDEWLQIQIDRISVHYWMARPDRIDSLLDGMRDAVAARGSARQRGRFFRALFQLRLRVERYAASQETVAIARACLAACDEAGDAAEGRTIRFALGTVLLWSGALDEAEERLLASLDEVEAMGDAVLQARCLTYLTQLHRRRRDEDGVVRFASRTIAAAEAGRMDEYVAAARANLGWVALARGDLDEAARSCGEAIDAWRRSSLVYPFQWTALLPLAATSLARGDLAATIEHARATLAPEQQRLPDAVARAIDAATDAARLEDALRAARDAGYP